MPEFETYVDVDVDEFWTSCSTREKESLIDMLEEDGWVIRTSPKGTDPNERPPSLLEIEWQMMVNKLSQLRQQITIEEEETIKRILEKY